MSHVDQVWSLFTRDLKRIRLLMLAHVICLALAIAMSTEVVRTGSSWMLPCSMVIICSLVVVSAFTVLNDNPVRDDAFWSTQPISGVQLAVAKLLVLFVLVLLTGVALLIAASTWGYSLSQTAGAIAYISALLAAVTVGVAVVAASGARDFVSWPLVGGVMLAVWFAKWQQSEAFAIGRNWWIATAVLLSVAGALFVLRQYRLRSFSSTSRNACLLLGSVMIALAMLTTPTPHSPAPNTSASDIALSIPLAGQPSCDRRRIIVPFSISSQPWERVELMHPKLSVSLITGGAVQLENAEWMQVAGLWGPIIAPALLSSVHDDDGAAAGERRIRRADIVFNIPAQTGASICNNVSRLDLRVQMRTATGEELLRVPLEVGTTKTTSGIRTRVSELTNDRGRVSVALSSMRADAMPQTDPQSMEYALRDTKSGTVTRLVNHSPEEWRTTTDLPGTTRGFGVHRLEAWTTGFARAGAFPEHAELILIAPRWTNFTIREVSFAVTPVLTTRGEQEAVQTFHTASMAAGSPNSTRR